MDEKKPAVDLALGLLIYCVASVATNVAVDIVRTKMKERRARKEAAANLCSND